MRRPSQSRLAIVVSALAVSLVGAPEPACAQGKLYALLAADTDAGVAGVERDAMAMESSLREGFGTSGRLNLRVLRGANLQPRLILNYFRTVPSGAGDTLLFYYSGHGAMRDGREHVLTTSHGLLARRELREVMEAKRPKLSVLLTDCCSTLVKFPPLPPTAGAPPPSPQVAPLLRCLFFEHRGTVDVTSSSFGEASWGDTNQGGFFTFALSHGLGSPAIEGFDADEDGFVSWTEFFGKIRRQTGQVYQNFRNGMLREARGPEDRTLVAELRVQDDQVPQAFSLGDRAGGGGGGGGGEFRAPNLGIRFELAPVGDAAGARLTQPPEPRSGGAQLQLEPGDTIYELDGLPIRHAVDVMNHHGRTDVVFINIQTGKPQRGVMVLPPYTPLPPEVPPEQFAANLGMHYQLISEGDGFGARLSRTASAGTPAGVLRLERGDMVVRLDDQAIVKPQDVLGHVGRTKVEFIDIRTGKLRTAVVQLPPTVPR